VTDLDRGVEAGRIDGLDRRREDEVCSGLSSKRDIGLEISRVVGEVFGICELGGVDEDADDGQWVLAR
jgi:hypothetical protein